MCKRFAPRPHAAKRQGQQLPASPAQQQQAAPRPQSQVQSQPDAEAMSSGRAAQPQAAAHDKKVFVWADAMRCESGGGSGSRPPSPPS